MKITIVIRLQIQTIKFEKVRDAVPILGNRSNRNRRQISQYHHCLTAVYMSISLDPFVVKLTVIIHADSFSARLRTYICCCAVLSMSRVYARNHPQCLHRLSIQSLDDSVVLAIVVLLLSIGVHLQQMPSIICR
uniref:Uncharacterized protein n=1 Tax=Leptocylindrus danicus TaxID=163516 RepID=A0A7S2LSM7_9STRA